MTVTSNDDIAVPGAVNGDSQAECSYCQLPVAGYHNSSEEDSPVYCCYGCRVAASVIGQTDVDRPQDADVQLNLTKLGLAIFFTMNVMVLTLALWSWEIYEDASLLTDRARSLFSLLRYASLFLASIVMVLLGLPLVENAVTNLLRGRFTIDLLIGASVLAAMAYSATVVIQNGQHTYFEVACMVLLSVTLGRWLEATGKLRTTNAVRRLQRLLPETVSVVNPDTDSVEALPLQELQVGSTVQLLAGQRVPVDGTVVQGTGLIDEQVVTGESQARAVNVDSRLFSGAIVQDGYLLVRATAEPYHGAISRIISAASQAAQTRGRLFRLSERLVAYFIPMITTVALATLAGWWWSHGLAAGLMAAMAVLLIACPCALGIATPLAVWAAIGRATDHGVLFQSCDAIEQLAKVDVICFDKTGTLTTGSPSVHRVTAAAGDVTTSLQAGQAIRIARLSNHPLARSIAEHFQEIARDELPLGDASVETHSGRGIRLQFPDLGTAFMGRLDWVEQQGNSLERSLQPLAERVTNQHAPHVAIAWNGSVQLLVEFQEQLRPDAAEAVSQLKQRGYQVLSLTGDSSLANQLIASQLEIESHAGLLPEEKMEFITKLQASGKSVAMLGDGINDTPALAMADVGIAMGCGADITRDSADICLLSNQPSDLIFAIDLSKRTMVTVSQNLFWAFAYNLVGVVFAVTGLLSPIFAAFAMAVSSLIVIGNSLRLLDETATSEVPAPVTSHQPTLPSPENQRRLKTA